MMVLIPPRRFILPLLFVTAVLLVYLLGINLEVTESHMRDQSRSHDSKDGSNYSMEIQLMFDLSRKLSKDEQTEEQQQQQQDKMQETLKILKQMENLRKPSKEENEAAEDPAKVSQRTEPDFFGEEYASDNQPPQTRCPTSIRKMVSQTPFASRFLESVPVLQWAKHFTPEKYKHLSQYHGTHGWGNVDIDVLNDSLTIMNTIANRLMFDDWEERRKGSECIRCAVVGNGGILNGSKKGKEIDMHDYVFRTNGAVIKGFEEDVGTRTTHYIFSTNTLRNSMRSYAKDGFLGPPRSKETRYVFLPDHDRDYILMKAAATHTVIESGPESSKKPPDYFGDDVTVEKFKMYHPDFVRYLRNRFLRSHILDTRYKSIYRPSTGATMLLAALHTCDKVSAYGFLTPDFSKYSDHYYDKTYHQVHFYANHDMKMELRLWQELHQAGLVQLYMRVNKPKYTTTPAVTRTTARNVERKPAP